VILSFSFANHSSYRNLQTISWVASSLKHPHRLPISIDGLEHRLLPCCAIYGANASGKSNALDAFLFFLISVVGSFRLWAPNEKIPRNAFQGPESSAMTTSRFQLDFLIEKTRFQYGFEINDSQVIEEWLFAYPGPRKQIWFHRRHGAPFEFGRQLKGANRSIEELTRSNALFLTVAAFHGHEQLSMVQSWLGKCAKITSNLVPYNPNVLAKLKEFESDSRMMGLIKSADLGVVGIRIDQPDQASGADQGATTLSNMLAHAPTHSKVPIIRLIHSIQGESIEFSEEQESDGTKVFVSRIPSLLEVLTNGGIYVVDEIDRSLHPSLCLQIVKLFLSPETNPNGAQILFTTHDTSLLSSGGLRRDEVWFAEKKLDGTSELYPLSDFSPRKNENLERGYLQGRYGGVPILNEATFWRAFEENPPNGKT
jgi:AAA15 family ATPase/GTPase